MIETKIKVVIMCSYPGYSLAESLGMNRDVIKRVTTWNYALIQELSKDTGIDLHVITGTNLTDTNTTIDCDNFKITYIAMHKWSNIFTLFNHTVNKTLKIIKEINPDIVHGIGTEHIWPYIAIKSKRPNLVTIHGILKEIIKRDNPPYVSKMRLFERYERKVFKQAANIISINPYVDEVLAKTCTAHRYPIENPVQHHYFDISNNDSDKYILFVGGIEKLKGIDVLLEAFEKISNQTDATLVIAGPDRDKVFAEKLRKKYKTLIDNKRVKFLGFIQPDELANYFQNSRFMVLPSLQETAPMSISEALATGTPVIASDVGGIKHMLDKNTGIVVESSNTDELVEALSSLTENTKLLSHLKSNAKTTAQKRWHPSIIASKTINAYREILG